MVLAAAHLSLEAIFANASALTCANGDDRPDGLPAVQKGRYTVELDCMHCQDHHQNISVLRHVILLHMGSRNLVNSPFRKVSSQQDKSYAAGVNEINVPTCGVGLSKGLGIAGGISRGKRLSSGGGIVAVEGTDGLGTCNGCKHTDTKM